VLYSEGAGFISRPGNSVSRLSLYKCQYMPQIRLAQSFHILSRSLFTKHPTIKRQYIYCGEGPRSRCYGRTAALRLIVQPCDEDDQFFSFFHVMEHRWNEIDRGKTEVLRRKSVPVPLCPPQIPHGLTRDWRTSAVRGRRLTAWAMARPSFKFKKKY
jgi:hypothetical protein